MTDKIETAKQCDPTIYGIDWEITNSPQRIKEKPFCEFAGCSNRVSTTFNQLKPYCTDHVLEYAYAKDVQFRLSQLDEDKDRQKATKALKKLEEFYDSN